MALYLKKNPIGTNPDGIAYLTAGVATHTLELVRDVNLTDSIELADPSITWETVVPGNTVSSATNPVSIAGNAGTATKLETARTINGVAFDGTANITITASVGNIPESQVTNLVSDLAAKAPLASPALTGNPTAPTPATADNSTSLSTTAFVKAQGYLTSAPVSSVAGKTGAVTLAVTDVTNAASLSVYSQYKTVFQASGSHIAAKVAGTYSLNTGNALVVSGGSSLYPPMIHYIRSTDFPTMDGEIPKLRIAAHLFTNDVAPTGNFTLGLYPVTRPATSGGAGLCIYTLGTVVAGSNGATFTAPAVDGMFPAVSADFALPADGFYVLGVITTATIATSALVQLTACLQMRNV